MRAFEEGEVDLHAVRIQPRVCLVTVDEVTYVYTCLVVMQIGQACILKELHEWDGTAAFAEGVGAVVQGARVLSEYTVEDTIGDTPIVSRITGAPAEVFRSCGSDTVEAVVALRKALLDRRVAADACFPVEALERLRAGLRDASFQAHDRVGTWVDFPTEASLCRLLAHWIRMSLKS